MFLRIDHHLWVHRPRHHDALFWRETEQVFDAITLRLELEKNIRLLGKKRHNLATKADIWIEGEAIGNLAGADAKEEFTMLGEQFICLRKEIIHITKNFESGILRKIVLQITVAAVHRAVAGEVDDEVITANLSVATRAF